MRCLDPGIALTGSARHQMRAPPQSSSAQQCRRKQTLVKDGFRAGSRCYRKVHFTGGHFALHPTPDIRQRHTHHNVLHLLRWGLVPHWSKDLTIGSRLFNARSESLTEKPGFRSVFVKRRCLIPADGIYEWDHQGLAKQKVAFIARLA